MNLINLIALPENHWMSENTPTRPFCVLLCHLCSTNLSLKNWFNFIGNLFLFYFLVSSFIEI